MSSNGMVEKRTRLEELQSLASRLGVGVGVSGLMDQALTHASVASDAPREPCLNYEPLEFVGDAVLGLVVTDHLYKNVPDRTPGEYSRMRARVVNRHALTRVARQLDIAPAIRLGRSEERSGGRQRKALLADCMEALIGAVYLDHGWETARGFVVRVFCEELEQAQSSDEIWDFKSRLQVYCQAKHAPLPQFEVVRSEGPDHRKEFEVEVSLCGKKVGRGSGLTKKEAERNAARAALEHEGQLLD